MIEWVVTSSVLILAVLALRRCLVGRVSLRLQYGLWLLVLVRLLLPVSFGGTEISVLNAVERAREQLPSGTVGYLEGGAPQLPAGEPAPDAPPEGQQWQTEPEPAGAVRHTALSVAAVLWGVWAAGAAGLGLWLLWVNLRFARGLRRSGRPLPVEGCPLPVYVTGAARTPCLFGLVRPRIYVTEEVAADAVILRHSLAHELTHYRHGDHIWAALRGLCLALHWYNPLVWLAAALSRRDGELCCDEATVRRLGEGERAAYGRTLLAVTCQERANPLLTATSMTGSGIKQRIFLLAKRPKTAARTLAAVALVAAVAVGCTFTGARRAAAAELERNQEEEQVGQLAAADLDRDGAEEIITAQQVTPELWQLVVTKQDGTQLLRENFGLPHPGWNSIYLCHDEQNGDCLLRYTPTMFTGLAHYAYTLFTLEGGGERVVAQGSVEFEASQVPERREELIAFADGLNALLRRSELLLSTQDGWLNVWPDGAGGHLEDLGRLEECWPKAVWLPGTEPASLPEEPVELVLASGASSWGSFLTLAPDGSFTGEYTNTELVDDIPSRYVCAFQGRFTDIRQIGTYTWSMTLAELTTQRPAGERWMEDGLQCISAEALGLAGGTEFYLYAPGTLGYDLPSACRNWWPGEYYWRLEGRNTLDGWCLYNATDGYGFFQSWLGGG